MLNFAISTANSVKPIWRAKAAQTRSLQSLFRVWAQGAKEMGGALDRVLVSLGLVSDVDAARALAEHLGLSFVPGDAFPAVLPEPEGLQEGFLRAHHVLPLQIDETGRLHVVMAAPHDAFVRKALRLSTGLEVLPALGLAAEIDRGLDRLFADPDAEEQGPESSFKIGRAHV